MMARASPWWVFAFAVCGARARRRGRGEEPRSMYFALHDLYNQTIDVWLLASYPHSGAGWVRNLWDVSLGIASESVHQVEGDTWNRRSGSWGTRCGSRPPPDARSAAAKRCEKVRRARRDDPILVATGYPHDATGGDRRGDVDGAVVVTRDARGWCERHAADRPEGRRDLAACAEDVAAEMANLTNFYLESDLRTLILSYDAMLTSWGAAAGEMRKLFDFARSRPRRDGLRSYPIGAPRGAQTLATPERTWLVQHAHDRYRDYGPRVSAWINPKRRGGFAEPPEGEFGVSDGQWISDAAPPPKRAPPRDDDDPRASSKRRRRRRPRGRPQPDPASDDDDDDAAPPP